MASFDVNAARAQRMEALGRSWSFELDDDTFELPTELSRATPGRCALWTTTTSTVCSNSSWARTSSTGSSGTTSPCRTSPRSWRPTARRLGWAWGKAEPRRVRHRTRRGPRSRPAAALRPGPARLAPRPALLPPARGADQTHAAGQRRHPGPGRRSGGLVGLRLPAGRGGRPSGGRELDVRGRQHRRGPDPPERPVPVPRPGHPEQQDEEDLAAEQAPPNAAELRRFFL